MTDMILTASSMRKNILLAVFGVVLIIGIGAAITKFAVHEPVASDSYLPVPTDLPEGWYAHRIGDKSILFTEQKNLPKGNGEHYSSDEVNLVLLGTTTLTPQAYMMQKPYGYDLDDALIKTKRWTKLHGHTLLQLEHETPAADALSDFLFIGDRIYFISLYPLPGGKGLGLFNELVDRYTADRTRRAISDEELAANCKKEIPPETDSVFVDLQVGIVRFDWWDNSTQGTAHLTVPYEPETDFAGCSESVKRQLQHIKEMNDYNAEHGK